MANGTGDKQPKWADGPYPLITTPRAKLNRPNPEPPAVQAATSMALLHNVFIRAINSVLLQAPHIDASNDDTLDGFLTYISALTYTIHEHHHSEEVFVFPLIESMTGVPGLMQRNVAEHQTFDKALLEFESWASDVQKRKEKWSSERCVELLKGFAGPLLDHLHAEIGTMQDLGRYEKFDWAAYNRAVEKHAVATADKVKEVPFIMTNDDCTFENGIHHDFPPLPTIARLMFRWIFVPRLKRAWIFSPSDASGRPRPLKYI